MKPTITIYKSNGEKRMTAQVGTGSKRYFMLMEKDYITLKFSSDEAVLLHLGDYVEIENVGRYEVTSPARGEYNTKTGGYDYEIQLDAQYWKFKNKLLKFLPQVGGNETSWSYTDTIANHAEQILYNLHALAYADQSESPTDKCYLYNGTTEWQVVWDDSVDAVKAITLTYDSTNIIDAIAAIAEAYECEWWFDANVLHFGKCQYGDPVNIELGKEIVAISRTDSTETYATRIYAYGSDKNIASNYRKSLIFDATISDDGKLYDPERSLEFEYFRKQMFSRCTADPAEGFTCDIDAITKSYSKASLTAYNRSDGNGNTEGTAILFLYSRQAANEINLYNADESSLPRVTSVAGVHGLKIQVTITELQAVNVITFKDVTITGEICICYYNSQSTGGAVTANSAPVKLNKVGETVELTFEDFEFEPECEIQSVRINHIKFYIRCNAIFGTSTRYAKYGEFSYNATVSGHISVSSYPEWCGEGVTIEVLDSNSGDVVQTIEGATFNDAYETSARKITLPQGVTIAAGTKYRLPQINTAITPARYFTSIYSVFSKYSSITTNGIVNSRLLLPEQDENGNPLKGYIDTREFESDDEAVEDVVIFDDIYPSRVSKITKLTRGEENTDKQQEQDSSITKTKWRTYRYQDDLFNDDNPFDNENYAIDGCDLAITFQSGMLNGMTFDVIYDETEHYFEIQRDSDTLLPNEILRPEIGDEFILSGFNIAMLSDSNTDYVSSAEAELLSKAREYAEKLNTDASTYQCTIGCDVAYEAQKEMPDTPYLGIGQCVNLIHPSYFAAGRISRVIGYEIPLDYVYDNPVFYIGEKASYSRIGELEDKLDSIGSITGRFSSVLGGGTSSSGSSSGGAYVIGRNDTTVPSDTNTYSALRSRIEFALKTAVQTIKHLWTFMQGIRIGSFISGISGAEIDSSGNAEVESLTVRNYMKIQELIYNRINAQEGETGFSDVGTIVDITDLGDGTQTAILRQRWEGDITTFQPGDIIYGYINNLDNYGTKESWRAWAWIKGVDRVNNEIHIVPYADSETPAGTNHAMTSGMVVTRWGNLVEPTQATYENSDYSSVIEKQGDTYVNTRQRSFFISCEDGNIIELVGVNSPKLEASNYGTVLGNIPDGMLDDETSELINKYQPYLFARGIIVQDIIRIGYNGLQPRAINYRGEWSYDTACSAKQYYRTTTDMCDAVTWNGALWQCVANGTTEEPTDASAGWLKMTASTDDMAKIWTIVPSTNIITVRDDVATPGTLSVTVTLHRGNIVQTIDSNDLAVAGAKLYYSVDDSEYEEFAVGAVEPLELEDESDAVELEESTDDDKYLMVGVDYIQTSKISDHVIFKLTDIETGEELAQLQVPVVRDGEKGDPGEKGEKGDQGDPGAQGRDGLMVYPAGYYDANATYVSTSETSPVVMYNEQYYSLRRGNTYTGADEDSDHNTPALDVANSSDDDSRWILFDKFNSIFANIIMADFAKLSSAVFYGDWMISQSGTVNGEASTDYEKFKTGEFTPNFSINFKTGAMNAANGVFSGSLLTKMKNLEDSDAVSYGTGYLLQNDLNIISGGNQEIVLPTDPQYIGHRVTICNNVVRYSRADYSTHIRTQDNLDIYGYPGAYDPLNYSGDYEKKEVTIMTGVIELIAVPEVYGDDEHCSWMIISINACQTS
jgi:hypothetical protein